MDNSTKKLDKLKGKLEKNVLKSAALQKIVGGRQSMYSSGAQSGNG